MALGVQAETLEDVPLIESDGEPLESQWHVLQIMFLIDLVTWRFRGRDDYFAGGNMFIYFYEEQARRRRFRGPDFFFVDGVNRLPMRRYWAVWLENGRFPNVILELLSPTTAEEDRTTKKGVYERVFKTHEYFCYDPDTHGLEGWRLDDQQRYQAIAPDGNGRMYVEEMGLWLGTWNGPFRGYAEVWLRFYDNNGQLVPFGEEVAERSQQHAQAAELLSQAAKEQAQAAKEQARAAEEQARAAKEQARAAKEQVQTAETRAQSTEQELAQLKARLAELEARRPDAGA